MAAKLKKGSTQRGAALARGGDTRMFGTGTRTRTATRDSAGKQLAGQTAQHATDNPKRAVGGSRTTGYSLSMPAVEGHTAPPRKGRGEVGRLGAPSPSRRMRYLRRKR